MGPWNRLIAAMLLSLYCCSVEAQDGTFDWKSLKGSDDLKWVSCYASNIECARLNAPLDYKNASAGTGTIAISRMLANVSRDSPDYRGPIFFNPGGPGGPGVPELTTYGSVIATTVGPNFDILVWDPRGIGESTPLVSFFTSEAEELSWDYSAPSLDTTNGPDAIPRMMARYHVLGALAKSRDTKGTLASITTENVARDMNLIVEKLGRDKIMFYGISYGTTLGATFATLFPEKIERFVLDGVLDGDVYYSNNWIPEIVDSDKNLQTFFDGCATAGPSRCAFYESTPAAIEKRLFALIDKLKTRPVPAYAQDSTSQIYGVVDYATVRAAVFACMYAPYSGWSPLAQALNALENGVGLPAYLIGMGIESPQSPPKCDVRNLHDDVHAYNQDAAVAIPCVDMQPVTETVDEMIAFFERNKNVSKIIDAGTRITCSGWEVHPNTFRGPTGANTSFPILVIGNVADPVTSLQNAKQTSSKFPGSVVLTYDIAGHTTFAAPFSACIVQHVAQYFINGTMPDTNTVCPLADGYEFFPAQSPAKSAKSRSDEYLARRARGGEVGRWTVPIPSPRGFLF